MEGGIELLPFLSSLDNPANLRPSAALRAISGNLRGSVLFLFL